jgi:hypothetical protein
MNHKWFKHITSSWTTNANYVFKEKRFMLSIPLSDRLSIPIFHSISYNRESCCIDIIGYMTTETKQQDKKECQSIV